jgi:hypothetical protein
MSMDLRAVTRAEMQMDRLELPDDATVQFIYHNGTAWIVLKTLTQADDWSITDIANLYINVGFKRFLLMDFSGIENILAQSEAVFFDGIHYRFEREYRGSGINRIWEFKLEPLDRFPTTLNP